MTTTGFDYLVARPDQINQKMWNGIQQLERDAYRVDLMDPALGQRRLRQDDVDDFVQWHDTSRYIETYLDPSLLVGNENNPDQEYSEPHVVLALEQDRPVGFLYTALNVSGSGLARQVKRRMPTKQYVWHRSIAVAPTERNKGVATALERIALEQRDSRMTVSAYVWVDFMGKMYQRLVDRGFVETERTPKPFVPRLGDSNLARLQVGVATLKRRGLQTDDEERKLVIRQAMQGLDNKLDI